MVDTKMYIELTKMYKMLIAEINAVDVMDKRGIEEAEMLNSLVMEVLYTIRRYRQLMDD